MEEKSWYSRSRSVPCQTQQYRSVAAIVVVVVLLEPLCDMIVDLLVVLEPRCEDLPAAGLTKQFGFVCVQAVYTSTNEEGTSTPG